jgi:lysophospholipase L1-like esterase
MEKDSKKLILEILTVIFFLLLVEIGSYFLLKKVRIDEFQFDTNPLIQKENGRPRLRKNPFQSDSKKYWVGVKKNPNRVEKNIVGAASFFKKEGLISSEFGDIFINKWGFRGPYFEKEKPENIFRIVSLGASTTLGWWIGNEVTYPRILERMLNNKFNKNKFFQVINAGQYEHRSCDVKRIYKKDVLKLKPDLLLIMSGWNDIQHFKNPRFDSLKSYCQTPSLFASTNTFRLLNSLRNEIFKGKTIKKTVGSLIDRNFGFYRKNLEETISQAQEVGTQVGLISIPTIVNKNMSDVELENVEKTKGVKKNIIKYHWLAGLRIDQLYRDLIKKYSNTFYIDSGLSFNSEGKKTFFWDLIHLRESGNRIQAFSIYQTLVKKFQIHSGHEKLTIKSKKISKRVLETFYIKGIFQANKIEDLSYSGCIAFHGMCDSNSYNDKFYSQLNGTLEFVLGSWLQFRKDVKNEPNKNVLKKLVAKALDMKTDYSLSYWISGIMNKEWGQSDEAEKNFNKAFALNPLLKSINFEREYKKFQTKSNPNPFLERLSDLIFILKKAPKNVSTYTFFWWLKHNQDAPINKQLEMTSFLYFANPLMAKSIFENLVISLIKNKVHPDVILNILGKIIKLKPEYNFKEYFSTYINKIKATAHSG